LALLIFINLNKLQMEVLKENWIELLIAFFAFLRVVFALYPTSKATKVFGYLDDLLAWVVQGDKVDDKKKKKK
tara:strand:+ start:15517 stop:15735 length:219 start_codon:yes stop_codon:yes gene_type:complete